MTDCRARRWTALLFATLVALTSAACGPPDSASLGANAEKALEALDGVQSAKVVVGRSVGSSVSTVEATVTFAPDSLGAPMRAAVAQVRKIVTADDVKIWNLRLVYKAGNRGGGAVWSADAVGDIDRQAALWARLLETAQIKSVGLSNGGHHPLKIEEMMWVGAKDAVPTSGDQYLGMVGLCKEFGVDVKDTDITAWTDYAVESTSVEALTPKLFAAVDRVRAMHAIRDTQVIADPAALSVDLYLAFDSGNNPVPLTDADRATILAAFDDEGLLTGTLRLRIAGSTGEEVIWPTS